MLPENGDLSGRAPRRQHRNRGPGDMAFYGEFEGEELELELLDLENEPGMEAFALDKPNLIQFEPFPKNVLMARVSGFDWKMDTPPPAARDPGRPVLKLHQLAVARIVKEIKARTELGSCVRLTVAGFADPGQESGIAASISEKRATVIFNQIWNRLDDAHKGRIKKKDAFGMGAASPIWPSDTHKHRALNRRVEVTIQPVDCFTSAPL